MPKQDGEEDGRWILDYLALQPLERDVIATAAAILMDPEFGLARQAAERGIASRVTVERLLIQIEPGFAYAQAMTLTPGPFNEDRGFVLGKLAFVSEVELAATLLHEIYRILSGQAGSGASGPGMTWMTRAADGFATQHTQLLLWRVRTKT